MTETLEQRIQLDWKWQILKDTTNDIKLVEDFIKKINTAENKDENTENLINVLNKYWQKILDKIENNFEIHKEDLTEKEVNIYNEAIKAFEEDIGRLWAPTLKLNTNDLKKSISERKSSFVEKQNKKINWILDKERKTEDIKDFFDWWSESDFNAIFDYIKGSTKPEDKEKFDNMVKKYIESNTETAVNITDITLNTATKDNSTYPEWIKIISCKIWDKPKTIVRWTQGHLQKLKAEKWKESLPKEIFWKDKDWNNLAWLNEFDGKWNYEWFKFFIEWKSDYVNSNLQNIINWVKTYKPKKLSSDALDYKNGNELRNNYANVLTDFIISSKNSNLQKNYLSQIKPENITMLWTNKKTQTENFNKIVKADLFKNLDEATRDQIINTKLSIEWTTKQNFEEWLKTWAKEIIKSFWWLILNIIELFWGKWLLKKFCSSFWIDYDEYFWEIEKLYDEKYQLNTDQIWLLKEISASQKDKKAREDWTNKMVNREWKNEITYNQDAIKNTYVENFKNEKNFKHLDPNLVEKALQTDNIKKLNIDQKDNIIIQERQSDGKIIKKINPEIGVLIDDNTRKAIVEAMINEWTRKEIQDAWNKISRSNSVYNSEIEKSDKMDQYKKDKVDAENNEAKEKKKAKWLDDANDIWMYLWIYLMKWSWDLKYSVSQTDWIPKTPDIDKKPDTKEEVKININASYIDTDWILKWVKDKRIDEIFDNYQTTAPENLLITPKWTQEEIKIKKGKIKIGWKDVNTYIYENKPTERVIINDWDKLTVPKE